MRRRRAERKLSTAVVCLGVAVLVPPGVAMGEDTVHQGWDLFQTEAGTVFQFPCPPPPATPTALQPIPFTGEPLDTFDFDGMVVQDLGATDTIVQRKESATVDDNEIEIELVALSLKSTQPVQVCGGPAEDLTVQLADDLGSTMTINGLDSEGDPHGAFDSQLHFTFTVTGSVTGTHGPFEKRLSANGQGWRHQPGANAFLINGVNHLLNGQNQDADFHPVGLVIEDDGEGTQHVARPTTLDGPRKAPALATWGVGLLAALLLLATGYAVAGSWAARRRAS